ncbi:MAG: thiamine pyrophosphate-dependent enzyme [Dehalogenimonas sp.]|uniref:Thiamine pyrophosphate-dependent enzyme n=1 Tax=Candidatus Dehalogenimonas loeffleri TaxID=3127115 RepID=A0ABZ2J225_9CHLR|nr:thiamine pyrophosphate-dependent enzyme [Dehalogenimonas sp.]
MSDKLKITLDDYTPASDNAWCPGCGNFGILRAVNQALVELQLEPWQVLMVSGIGQAAKLPHYTRTNIFNGLHGRPLPAAIGAKTVNAGLTVIAESGDGDAYGEGGNHFIHTMNRNPDITYLVHNNQVYGLTKGQASPTTDLGFTTKMNPDGAWTALHPLALAVAADCSFIARGFAGDLEQLAALIAAGVRHPGFALVEILQPCVSFNKKNTFQWYQERVYKLEDESGYDTADRTAAFGKALEWGDKIPTGVIYRHPRETFDEYLGTAGKEPLVLRRPDIRSVADLFEEFR